MDTLEFLRWLLPPEGNVVLGVMQHGQDYWKNRKFETIEAAAEAALNFDTDSEVYVALHTFGDWYQNKNGKTQIRTQENALACKVLYDDFDVDANDAKKYGTKAEARGDIIKLAQALRLTPTIVDSGGGYHCYFSLDEAVLEETWKELSALKRQVTTFLGLKADRAVDMDSARVLRPIGTSNKKYEAPIPVRLLKKGKEYSVDTVRDVMLGFISKNGLSDEAPTSGFGHVEDYKEPLDRDKARVAALKGEDWHNNVRSLVASWVAKGNTDSEIHELAKEFTLDGYSKEETHTDVQTMIDGARDKGFAPPDIAPLASDGGEDDDPATNNGGSLEGQTIPYWNANYRWNGVALSVKHTDADGVSKHRPFCRSFIYPVNRIRDSEGTWVIHWRAKEKNGKWREFFMPTAELASTDLMAKTFASHEVFLMRTRNARSDMAEFAENLIETLQAWKIETKTYGQFGWLPDYSGFVMGTKMVTEKGTQEVLCDSGVPSDISLDFGQSGTLDEWVANIATLYNRPGAEPFQFALCHSMGSILVELMGSSNWHGLPLAFTGHGGTGKSTAAKIACGFYGNPEYMERQTGEQGSTLNAVIKRIAIMGAVPLLLDEFSGRSPDELTRTGYALANGRDKERLATNGKFATVGGQWFKNSFITSNDSILENISKLPAGYRVEATQLRFFEVSLPQDFRTKVFPDISQAFVENHMDHVYGEACLPYIRFLIKNMDWARRQMVAARSKFNPQSADDNKERFYRDTIVTALVAGKIAQKIGLVSFDVSAMTKWATNQVTQMRESRKEINTDIREHLAAFISTLQGRLIITKRLYNNSARKEESAVMLRSPAVGRVCTDDKKAFVTIKAITDWCKENGVAPASIREELDRDGYLVYQADGTVNPRMYIGKGSTIPTGQTRCYEIKYHKLMDGSGLAEVPAAEDKDAVAS